MIPQIETKIKTDMFGYDLLPDKEMTYTLRITNKQEQPINNMVVRQTIPEEVELVRAYVASNNNNDVIEGIYNSETKEVTFNIDTLKKEREIKVIVKGKKIAEYEKWLLLVQQ